MQTVAEAFVTALTAYMALGLVFALPFVVWGIQRLDPAARGGTWGFRLLALPASAALWPLLLQRLVRGAPPPEERTAHRRATGSRNKTEDDGGRSA